MNSKKLRIRERKDPLTHQEQLRVIYWIALYHSDKEVIENVLKETGKEITVNTVHHYRTYPAWSSNISKIRDEFEAKISDEIFASKRKRIQELTEAYYRLKPEDETLMDAVTVLGRIREEMEGKASSINNITQYNQYNGMSDEDLRKVIAENNRFLEIAEKRKKELGITIETIGEPIDGA